MPNLCGVNQKQLSDALIEIKRSATTNTAPPSFANKDQQLVNGVGNKFKVIKRLEILKDIPLFQNLFRAQVSGGDSVADKSNEISEPLGGGNADSPRQYKLTNFHIHKVLGKGSFGKVGGKGF